MPTRYRRCALCAPGIPCRNPIALTIKCRLPVGSREPAHRPCDLPGLRLIPTLNPAHDDVPRTSYIDSEVSSPTAISGAFTPDTIEGGLLQKGVRMPRATMEAAQYAQAGHRPDGRGNNQAKQGIIGAKSTIRPIDV